MDQLKWKVQKLIEAGAHSSDDITEELNTDEVVHLSPMLVFLALIIVTGIPGNGLVCYIYRSKYNLSSSRWFIFFLAVVDIIMCVVIIPEEIMTSLHQYTFTNTILCRATVFFNLWSLLALGLTLLIVSIDRFRKVCKPTSWQIDFKKARVLCGVALVSAFFISLPVCWIYDINTTSITTDQFNVTINECSIKSGSSFAFAYVMFGMVMFIGALMTICILYGFIGAEIKQHIHRERIKRHLSMSASMATSHRSMRPLTEQLDVKQLKFCQELVKKKSVKFQERHEIKAKTLNPPAPDVPEEISTNHDTADDDDTSGNIIDDVSTNNLSDADTDDIDKPIIRVKSIRTPQKTKSRKLRKARARKATFSMFLISIAFVLSYLPFLALLLARSVITDFDDNLSDTGRAIYKFCLRSYFLNCAMNPFIYGVSDSRFRQSCREVISNVFQRCRKFLCLFRSWNPRA